MIGNSRNAQKLRRLQYNLLRARYVSDNRSKEAQEIASDIAKDIVSTTPTERGLLYIDTSMETVFGLNSTLEEYYYTAVNPDPVGLKEAFKNLRAWTDKKRFDSTFRKDITNDPLLGELAAKDIGVEESKSMSSSMLGSIKERREAKAKEDAEKQVSKDLVEAQERNMQGDLELEALKAKAAEAKARKEASEKASYDAVRRDPIRQRLNVDEAEEIEDIVEEGAQRGDQIVAVNTNLPEAQITQSVEEASEAAGSRAQAPIQAPDVTIEPVKKSLPAPQLPLVGAINTPIEIPSVTVPGSTYTPSESIPMASEPTMGTMMSPGIPMASEPVMGSMVSSGESIVPSVPVAEAMEVVDGQLVENPVAGSMKDTPVVQQGSPFSVVFHKLQFEMFFGTSKSPNIDLDLYRSIQSANSYASVQEMKLVMDLALNPNTSQILISSRAYDGDDKAQVLQEMHEILQLYFCVLRNLSTGTRVPSAKVSLRSLANLVVSGNQTMNPVDPSVPSISGQQSSEEQGLQASAAGGALPTEQRDSVRPVEYYQRKEMVDGIGRIVPTNLYNDILKKFKKNDTEVEVSRDVQFDRTSRLKFSGKAVPSLKLKLKDEC